MELSSLGLQKIISKKKLYLNAYLNENKKYAIGYGTTTYPNAFIAEYDGDVKAGNTIDEFLAMSLLKHEIEQIDQAVVNKFVTVPLTQNQFDALVMICNDIGVENFIKHPAIQELNKLNYREAIGMFLTQYKLDRLYMPSRKEITNRDAIVKLFLS